MAASLVVAVLPRCPGVNANDLALTPEVDIYSMSRRFSTFVSRSK
jgi:hypothetical protein